MPVKQLFLVLILLAASSVTSSSAPAASEGEMCGGIGGIQCADGLYCADLERCGAGDGSGTCKAKPDVCTMQYEPVCGCDGNTHGNACEAATAGVSVNHAGECRPQK